MERKVALYDGLYQKTNELWNENQELKSKIWRMKDKLDSMHIELQQAKKRDILQDALDYFSATDGNYSGDTAYYLNTLINHINK